MSERYCNATACHCDHTGTARYLITFPNGDKEAVCMTCADLHVMAGYSCRKLSIGDVMAGVKTRSEVGDE